jgi:hypothetical protein
MFFRQSILALEWPKEPKFVKQKLGILASHDEITRMLAEHGSLELLDY